MLFVLCPDFYLDVLCLWIPAAPFMHFSWRLWAWLCYSHCPGSASDQASKKHAKNHIIHFPSVSPAFCGMHAPRFSKKTQIWPAAGQVQTQMGQMGSRSLSQSDRQSAAPQGSRGEIPFAGGSPHIKDLNWSYINLSHHPLQQFIKFPKLFPGIWPQMAELAQGREGLGHTVSVMTAELMGLRLLSCYLLPIRMNPLPSAKQLLICCSTSLRGARLRACLTVNSSKPRTGGFMTCIRTLLEHPLRPPTPWLKQDRSGEAGFLFGKCFFVQRNEYQPNGTNELQGEGSWAALEW